MTNTTKALFRNCAAASAALALPALVLVSACGTNERPPSNASATVSAAPAAPPAAGKPSKELFTIRVGEQSGYIDSSAPW